MEERGTRGRRSWRGARALVIGGASGIGRALVEALAARGSHVVVADLDEEAARRVAEEVGGDAARLDVTDADAVDALVRSTAGAAGRLDLLIVTAGIAIAGELRDATPADFRNAVEVNLMGTVYSVMSAYREMAVRRSGTICTVASGSGLFPLPARTHYTTSKFGVVGFTTALRQEARRLGVQVNVVCPGVVKTPIFGHVQLIGPIDREAVERRLAANRGITPERAAKLILRGLQRNRPIITLDAQIRVMWLLWRIAPRAYERFLGRYVAVLEEMRTDGAAAPKDDA